MANLLISPFLKSDENVKNLLFCVSRLTDVMHTQYTLLPNDYSSNCPSCLANSDTSDDCQDSDLFDNPTMVYEATLFNPDTDKSSSSKMIVKGNLDAADMFSLTEELIEF